MSRSLDKSINSLKQKVEKCDEIMYIITLFIIQWPKKCCHLMVLILIIREIFFEYIQLGVNQVL